LTTDVYSDDPVVKAYLQDGKSSKFRFNASSEKCKYWYTLKQVKFGVKGAIPQHVVGLNQFPFEAALVRTDICLVQVCRACLRRFPEAKDWVLPAYDLETELGAFLELAKRQQTGSLWAIKPAQQARSAGVVVTDSMDVVLASMTAPGGDKVAQEYVTKPFLLQRRRKFDLRTVVLVRSFKPLVAWVNMKATYARIARDDFDLGNLFGKRSHLTVSRYDATNSNGGLDRNNDFPPTLSLDELFGRMSHSEQEWWISDVQPNAIRMMRQILQAAGHFVGGDRFPPCSGACYGVDWIVDETGKAKLIEVNFGPDLTVANSLLPNLIEDVLSVMTAGDDVIPELGEGWLRLI
jgi:hypothetical protein